MIILHKGTGSPHVYPVARQATFANWAAVRQRVTRMLRARGYCDAAQLLDKFPFEIWEGTNSSEDHVPARRLGSKSGGHRPTRHLQTDADLRFAPGGAAEVQSVKRLSKGGVYGMVQGSDLPDPVRRRHVQADAQARRESRLLWYLPLRRMRKGSFA
jgi:hypothetical protein